MAATCLEARKSSKIEIFKVLTDRLSHVYVRHRLVFGSLLFTGYWICRTQVWEHEKLSCITAVDSELLHTSSSADAFRLSTQFSVNHAKHHGKLPALHCVKSNLLTKLLRTQSSEVYSCQVESVSGVSPHLE